MYSIVVQPSAAKFIAGQNKKTQRRLIKRIRALGENPIPKDSRKLRDNIYRVRVGDYRIIYEVRKKLLVVLVAKVGNRRDVYRNLRL